MLRSRLPISSLKWQCKSLFTAFTGLAPSQRHLSSAIELVNTPSDTIEIKRVKHKIPKKKASKLFEEIYNEEMSHYKRPDLPKIRAGDGVYVTFYASMSDKQRTELYKGTVIGVYNKGIDACFKLLQLSYGEKVLRTIPFHSPLLKEIQVVSPAHIHRGRRRVRRSKLYYLMDRDPPLWAVK